MVNKGSLQGNKTLVCNFFLICSEQNWMIGIHKEYIKVANIVCICSVGHQGSTTQMTSKSFYTFSEKSEFTELPHARNYLLLLYVAELPTPRCSSQAASSQVRCVSSLVLSGLKGNCEQVDLNYISCTDLQLYEDTDTNIYAKLQCI